MEYFCVVMEMIESREETKKKMIMVYRCFFPLFFCCFSFILNAVGRLVCCFPTLMPDKACQSQSPTITRLSEIEDFFICSGVGGKGIISGSAGFLCIRLLFLYLHTALEASEETMALQSLRVRGEE